MAAQALPDPCGDDLLSAAYFAFARREDTEEAVRYIRRLSGNAERLLLIANFISRRGIIPNPRPDSILKYPDGRLTSMQQQQSQEDCFRKVISDPGTDAPLRESGRAKHEFGYLMQALGKNSAAEVLYSQALSDLEKCPQWQHDFRWHGAFGKLLPDLAGFLSASPARLVQAREFLDRAMAIHVFHGRRLQIAYCLDTAARINLAGQRFNEAIENAFDSANLFEVLNNWRGWGEAMQVLFDCFAETRETARMLSYADLAIDKLQGSNLPPDQRDRQRPAFVSTKARAHFIAGRLAEARSELGKLLPDFDDQKIHDNQTPVRQCTHRRMAVRWHNGNNAGLRNLGLSIDGHLTLNHFVSSLSSGAGSRLYRECEQQAGLKQERATWRLPSLYDLL